MSAHRLPGLCAPKQVAAVPVTTALRRTVMCVLINTVKALNQGMIGASFGRRRHHTRQGPNVDTAQERPESRLRGAGASSRVQSCPEEATQLAADRIFEGFCQVRGLDAHCKCPFRTRWCSRNGCHRSRSRGRARSMRRQRSRMLNTLRQRNSEGQHGSCHAHSQEGAETSQASATLW
jgi:hypothetical protein